MGKEYNLESSLKDDNIYASRTVKLENCNLIGFVEFTELLLGNHIKEVAGLLKTAVKPGMMDKDWEGFILMNLPVKKEEPMETVLVKVDKQFIFEKFTRDYVIPLNLTTTTLKTFCNEVSGYSKRASQREKERGIREAAELMVKKVPTLSMDDAINLIKSKA